MATRTKDDKPTAVGPVVSDAANLDIEYEEPYFVQFEIEGTAAMLFHAWNNEAVAEKASAAKNSKAKKTDNVESYVYRTEEGEIGLPGVYLHASMCAAAKFRQDPRSPRKSAFDLYKAAVSPVTELASLGKTEWDYLDRRRVTVQRNGVTRERPAFLAGWRAEFDFIVNLPEYVRPMNFLDVLVLAGRAVGVADFRPTYGRFAVVRFDHGTLD